MPDSTDLTSDIASQAVEPVSSSGDGQSTTGRSISELIEADKYLAAKAASRNKRRGLLFTKLLPPPAAPGDCPAAGGFGGGVQ